MPDDTSCERCDGSTPCVHCGSDPLPPISDAADLEPCPKCRRSARALGGLAVAVAVLLLMQACATSPPAGIQTFPGLVITIKNPFDCTATAHMYCAEKSPLNHECRCAR